MVKKDELADPNSCLNKAADDEIVFVLRAKDPEAPETIRDWVKRRVAKRKNLPDDPKILDALDCANRMEQQYLLMIGQQPVPMEKTS